MSAIIAMAGGPHKGVFARKPVADIIVLEGGLGIWIAIGLAIYFLYGRFQSRLRTT